MNEIGKSATWRGKTSRVKSAGSKSLRRVKRARQTEIVRSMISFSGPNDGIVEIWCGETRSQLLLPVRWAAAVVERLAGIVADAAAPEVRSGAESVTAIGSIRDRTPSVPEIASLGPSS
jgi:hypothetical protein